MSALTNAELDTAIERLQALREGRLEWQGRPGGKYEPVTYDNLREHMLFVVAGATAIRIAPAAQSPAVAPAPNWPPKPTEEQLRKMGKVIAEPVPRAPVVGVDKWADPYDEPFVAWRGGVSEEFGGLRWILKDAPPEYAPWAKEQIPVGALYRWKGQNHVPFHITDASRCDVKALCSNAEWCWPHEQFDNKWRPCGVRK